MSKARHQRAADLFSALGDPTRLAMVGTLGSRGARSATQLASGAKVTRQAIVKHLQVLEGAGLVTRERMGREVLYTLEPNRLDDAHRLLDEVSAHWDRALARLRQIVEPPLPPTPRRPPKRR